MLIGILFVLTEMKQVVMVFSFFFRFSAEIVWKVQRRNTKVFKKQMKVKMKIKLLYKNKNTGINFVM